MDEKYAGYGGSALGDEARARILSDVLIRVLSACFTPDFTPKAIEGPINNLIRLFPQSSQADVQRVAHGFVSRAAGWGNPNEAADAMVDLLAVCFSDSDPTEMRPQFNRILAAYTNAPETHKRLASAITSLDARAGARAVADEKKLRELEQRLRMEVEEHFLRSERAAMLVQRLHQEAANGRRKEDALSVHGVTWYEPASGREIRRTFVLDKIIGPKIHRVIEQLKRRFVYMDLNLRAPVRIMMGGPPGVGKTMAARYIASFLGKPCAVMRLDEIVGKLIGDTAKNINAVLEAAVARRAVLFLDEVDGLFPPRDGDLTGSGGEELRRITAAFLQQVNLLPKKQIVICATNRPDALDIAFLRRFPDTLTFTNPDEDTRREIARRTWKRLPFEPAAHDLLVQRTADTSGDHVTVVAMAAARIAADIILDDAVVMAGVVAEAETMAATLIAAAEATAAARKTANPGNQVPNMVEDPSDADLAAAAEALEVERAREVAQAKVDAQRSALRKTRKRILLERVRITRGAVDQALRDTPPPPVYLARDKSGRVIPMPARPGSPILLPGDGR